MVQALMEFRVKLREIYNVDAPFTMNIRSSVISDSLESQAQMAANVCIVNGRNTP